ncbi:Unknown protein, partial [Striga hermonthica]
LAQKLNCISLSAKESHLIDIEHKDIKLSADECQRSLFGKIVGDRKASWIGVQRTMSHIWKLKQPMEVKDLGYNFFQFTFQNKDDLKKVISGTNWVFENQYLIILEWQEGISSKHEGFNELQLWVQALNIPLNWLSTDVGLKVGSVFKEVKNVVLVSSSNHGGRILRLLVKVNLKEALPRCASIRLGSQIVKVSFQYEKLVNLCHYCGFIGHLDRDCSNRLEDIKNRSVNEGQYGDWMKAAEGTNWVTVSSSGPKPSQNSGKSSAPTSEPQPHASSSQTKANQQLTPASVKQITRMDSDTEASNSIQETPLQVDHRNVVMVEAQITSVETPCRNMEIEVILNPIQSLSTHLLPEGEKGINTTIARTWKRSSTTSGRLQRQDPLPVETLYLTGKTKKPKSFVNTVSRKLGFDDRSVIVDPQGQSGYLLLLWNQQVTILQTLSKDFFIAIQYQLPNSDVQWGVFVYLSTCRNQRSVQWQVLESLQPSWGEKWFIAGDWNSIFSNEEKIGGNPRHSGSFSGFNQFINHMDMEEIQMAGYQFTWCNNRVNGELIEEKLDRAFGSMEWLQSYPNAKVLNKARSSSDHSLLLLDQGTVRVRTPKRFSFDKRWIGKDGLTETVEKAWTIQIDGTPLFQLKERVKATGIALLRWSSSFHTQNQLSIASLTNKLELLREDTSDTKWEEWASTRSDLNKAHFFEESYWQQKSRATWIKNGDNNTKFFHAYVQQRRRQNVISRLVSARGEEFYNQKDMEAHIEDFYSKLFTTEGSIGGDSILQLSQSVNLQKSAIFFSKNTPPQIQHRICSSFHVVQSHRSTRYLGLPLGIGRSKKEVFDYLL